VTIHKEWPRGVNAKAAKDRTVCGEGRAGAARSEEESGVEETRLTTERSKVINELRGALAAALGSFRCGAMDAMSAERLKSGARLTKIARRNRTGFLKLTLAQAVAWLDRSPRLL